MKPRKSDDLFPAHAILASLRSGIRLLAIGLGALTLIYAVSGLTLIGPNETGLILRFGKLLPQIHPPGLLLALPPPFDEVVKVPVKTVQESALDLWSAGSGETDASLNPVTEHYTLTGDANIVRARFVVRYQISDPIDYTLTTLDRDQLRDGILYQSAGRVIASMPVEEALTTRKNYIGMESMSLAQAELDRLHAGLHLIAFEVRDISPPRSVVAAFQAVISAKVQANTLIEQANAAAATALPAARAEAFRTEQEAAAGAAQTIAQAQGEVVAFSAQLQQYRANPMVFRARLTAEMREAVLPTVKVLTVMPEGSGATRLFLSP